MISKPRIKFKRSKGVVTPVLDTYQEGYVKYRSVKYNYTRVNDIVYISMSIKLPKSLKYVQLEWR